MQRVSDDRSPDDDSIRGTIELCRYNVFDGEPDGSGDYGHACSNRKVIELCESVLALRAAHQKIVGEHAALVEDHARCVRALRAYRTRDCGGVKPCGHDFFCVCASEAAVAALSSPLAKEVKP